MNLHTIESLTVPGTLDSLSAIAQYVLMAARISNLEQKNAYRLRLAVDEIATNIIGHGYEEAGLSGQIHLSAFINDQTVTILIEDTGVPYNPTQKVPPDDLSKSLEERQIGGLGVYLATQEVDQFQYQRVGNKNHNIFVMKRPIPSSL